MKEFVDHAKSSDNFFDKYLLLHSLNDSGKFPKPKLEEMGDSFCLEVLLAVVIGLNRVDMFTSSNVCLFCFSSENVCLCHASMLFPGTWTTNFRPPVAFIRALCSWNVRGQGSAE